jgi:hypothetical protein
MCSHLEAVRSHAINYLLQWASYRTIHFVYILGITISWASAIAYFQFQS